MGSRLGVLASALSGDVRESLRQAARLGFAGVQFEITSNSWLAGLDRSGQRELIKVLAASSVRLLSLATSAGRKGFAPAADVDRSLAHLEQCLKVAADLGKTSGSAVTLCVDIGPLPPPRVEPAPAAPAKPVAADLLGLLVLPTPEEVAAATTRRAVVTDPPDENFERHLGSVLTELGRLADRYSVGVAMRSELGSLASLGGALSSARCPWFGLDLDPVALLQEPALTREEAIGAFSGRVLHLRARDATRGAGGRTQPADITRGSTDWPSLLRLLRDASFAGPIVIDPTELRDRGQGAAEALRVLRPLVEVG